LRRIEIGKEKPRLPFDAAVIVKSFCQQLDRAEHTVDGTTKKCEPV
jgi:hypothetical protein